jgi:hypothetical protein
MPNLKFFGGLGAPLRRMSRAQKTAQAFAKILNTAGVNYAVLGQERSLHRRLGKPRGTRRYLLRLGFAERGNPQRGRTETHCDDLSALSAYDQE